METAESSGSVMDQYSFTAGWICALAHELEASVAVLDQLYTCSVEHHASDPNNYVYGRVNQHKIVLACLPEGVYGSASAAAVASHMHRTFPALRFVLMVGIGGGIWTVEDDVRLGDVVVSTPKPEWDAVIQYDLGKADQGGQFKRRGSMNKPPVFLLSALGTLRSRHAQARTRLAETHAGILGKTRKSPHSFDRPDGSSDVLYASECSHPRFDRCAQCEAHSQVVRAARVDGAGRLDTRSQVHYGLIGSGNRVIGDAGERSRLRSDAPILCFEMEAAGLADSIPYLVIRGICDYADSYKNDRWQNYAAAMAAAFARLLLETLPVSTIQGAKTSRQLAKLHLAEKLERLARDSPLDPAIKREVHLLESDRSLLVETDHYWSHVTEVGFRHYERLTRQILSQHESKTIDILTFADRLGSTCPEASHLIDVWERFDNGYEARLPRNAILAVIYMLHVEYFDARFRSQRLRRYHDGKFPISPDRAVALRCFGRWERCPHSSTCPVRRNFANNQYGLARYDVHGGIDCPVQTWCDEKIKSAGMGGRHASLLTQEQKTRAQAQLRQNHRAWYSQPQEIN